MTENTIKHGLKENASQFWILVLVNAFVGGMVGLERSILPEIAEKEFHIDSNTAILLFIIAFGITKAITNYFTGKLANKLGRKNLLVIGWLFALPIPLLLIYAESWNVVIFANILLGINQGLTWSSTVVMKIDLVGEKDRGFAMGLNEFSGYFAVGLIAFLSAVIAEKYGLRPYPFYLGIGLSILGLLFSIFLVKDTRHHVAKETSESNQEKVKNVFWNTTFKNRNLSATTQAGLVNNLNDGMIWGLLPLLLLSENFGKDNIGIITATYPLVWGLGQLFTGKFADLYSNKKILFYGMLLQGIAISILVWASSPIEYILLCVVLGLGTALVYPTFLVVIAKNTTPSQRPESIGVFRLWRDLGYAIGALISGLIADAYGLEYAILSIGLLTILSSVIIQLRMKKG
ncbi:MAG: MFS transporter [Flavobacteriaceae bacterium]|nr:MFS transporter [Flavobacteriaceae bacterium]